MKTRVYSKFAQIVERFRVAVSSVAYVPSSRQLELWASELAEAMAQPGRVYHDMEHVIEVSEGLDPIGALAALYHDAVYAQVDGGVFAAVDARINGYYYEVNGVFYVQDLPSLNFTLDLACSLFGFASNQQLLASRGQNEFLSALYALESLASVLSRVEMVAVCACIEATIPFRGQTDAMRILRQRIERFSLRYNLGMTPAEVDAVMQRCVTVANRDVANFAYHNVADFLAQTWRLLPELHLRLGCSSLFTAREYRMALLQMEGFLSTIQPESIFYFYENDPNPSLFEKLLQRCRRNLDIAAIYLRVEMYAAVILETLLELTGGDLPMVYATGGMQASGRGIRLEAFLRQSRFFREPEASADRSFEIAHLLETGRSEPCHFTSQASPLGFYFYELLGERFIVRQFTLIQQYVARTLSAEEFLRAQPTPYVLDVAAALAQLVFSRKRKLSDLEQVLTRTPEPSNPEIT